MPAPASVVKMRASGQVREAVVEALQKRRQCTERGPGKNDVQIAQQARAGYCKRCIARFHAGTGSENARASLPSECVEKIAHS